uniref:Glutaredoxin-1 n=1 Tax=Sphenodon punctatus TaxID=8508 RepID=A0A8D0G872_SPHPU
MAQQFVNSKIKSDKVTVFGKPACPYCRMALELLSKYPFKDEHLEFIDITSRSDMESIQKYFQQATGARTVPRVYIGETCIGGYTELEALHKKGELSPRLQQIGALQ